MSTYTEALSRASHVLRQIGAMPNPRADDLARADEEPAPMPAAPLRPTKADLDRLAKQYADAGKRKTGWRNLCLSRIKPPAQKPLPDLAQTAARLAEWAYRQWWTGNRSIVTRGVMEAVAAAYGLTVDGVLRGGQDQRTGSARAAAMYALRRCGLSFPEVTKAVGRRNHSTAISAVRRVERAMQGQAA